MKSNFLASMSHELRTPLNSIIGFSEIIYSLTLNQKESHNIDEYSKNILESAKHLLHLINDILDYSKIEAGEFVVHKEPALILDIFNSCQILLQERAKQFNLSLIIKTPPDDLYLDIDAIRIKQVLINLLTNAIKFNRANGKIALTWQINDNNEVVLSIIDTGIGMKQEDVQHAFDKFRQIDGSRNRYQEGTGLGLSISKSLVELHGGRLEINSVYGKGTKVSIILPSSVIYKDNDNDNINLKLI
jgi:two-component system cell cycle sensor histidine kinase PleC